MTTPIDLNTHLFEQLIRLRDAKGDDLKDEIARSAAIVDISEQVISNNNMRLNAAKLVAEYNGMKGDQVAIPQNLIG